MRTLRVVALAIAMIFTFDEPGWGFQSHGDDNDAVIGPVAGDLKALILTAPTPPLSYPGTAQIYGALPIVLVPGKLYVVRAKIDGDTAIETTPIQVLINGAVVNFAGVVYKSQIGAGLQLIELGSFIPTEAALILFGALHNSRIQDPSNPTVGRWVVGEIEIDEVPDMPKAMWNTIDAAWSVFKGINGVNLHTNLQSRAYTRDATPETDPDREFPWGTLAEVSPGETRQSDTADLRTFRTTWIFYFADNAESDVLNTSGAKPACDFSDDVWEVFQVDPTLSGTCHACRVVSCAPIFGRVAGFAMVEAVIEHEQWIGAGDLRPA